MKIALKIFLLMTVLTGFAYPLLITGIAQMAMPWLANGSLIYKEGKVSGSALLAQKSGARYFWPRPSAIDYDPIRPSGGSNLGPTSIKLKELITERKKQVGENAPAELLYASGSGLDPHIGLMTAYFQIERVAKERGISEAELKQMIDSLSLGKHYVNVLLLNQKLDERP